MDMLESLIQGTKSALPSSLGMLGIIIALYIIRLILDRKYADKPGHRFKRQILSVFLLFAGLILIIMVAPFTDTQRGQLLSLIGILLTAAIALSSTTLVGNIMAGIMLRAMKNFKPGEFIRIEDYFGRVTERGLFHIEIQNDERDLITLPNIYVASHAVEVIRPNQTIISAHVSLGYDIPQEKVKELLLKAAEHAELTEPFVHIVTLGDFSVTYRIGGMLADSKYIITARSRLREKMLDSLHHGGLEIVSPTFMNTRNYTDAKKFIPPRHVHVEAEKQADVEEVAFDKADEAESIEKLQETFDAVCQRIKDIKENLKSSSDTLAAVPLQQELEQLKERKTYLADLLTRQKGGDS